MCYSRLGDVFLDVAEELGGGCFGGDGGGGEHSVDEAGGSVSGLAPGIHGIEGGLRAGDDAFEAVGVEGVEVGVGDKAADLEDSVGLGVEAGHLGLWLADEEE